MKNNTDEHVYGEPLRNHRDYGEEGCGLGLASEVVKIARLVLSERPNEKKRASSVLDERDRGS